MTKETLNEIVKIANANFLGMANRTDLEQHFSDEEDFFEASVWELKAALTAAYEFGKQSK